MKYLLSLLGVVLAVSTPLSTRAETDNGLYLAASIGAVDGGGSRKGQADTSIRNLGLANFQSSIDEKDTGYKLQLGYRINRYVAIEGGYIDLGSYVYDASSVVPKGERRVKGDISAWNIGALGILPLGQVNLFGKLGVAAYQLKFHCSGLTPIPCVNPDRKDNGTSWLYGVGAEWNFMPQWFVRAEYEVVQKVGEDLNAKGTTGTTRADVKMGSLGVGYRF